MRRKTNRVNQLNIRLMNVKQKGEMQGLRNTRQINTLRFLTTDEEFKENCIF
jgi:hypothetical protein